MLSNIYFSKENLQRRKKILQQLAQQNSTLSADEIMVLNTPDKVFPNMPKLEELDLSHCSIYYIEKDTFGAMPLLKSLLLSNNQLVKFSTLNSPVFSQLLYLDLSYNPLKLNTLNFTPFPVLKTLDLSYTNGRKIFRNTFRTSSTELTKLSICYSELSYIADNAFINLYKLKVLDLQGNTNLGKHLSEGTFNGLTSLEELHLADCTQKVQLRENSQHGTKIRMDSLQKLTSLKRINLAKNGITNISSETVDMLTQLESLDLSINYIGSWNVPLYTNTSLRNLNIAHNHLNYITDAMLQDFSPLSTLIISYNPFVCDCNCRKFLELTTNITVSSESSHQNPPNIDIPPYETYTRSTSDNHKIRQTNSSFKAMYPTGDSTNDFTQHREEQDAYVCLNKTDSNEMKYIYFKDVSCNKRQEPIPPTDAEDNDNDPSAMNSSEKVAITSVAVVLIISIAIGITYWKWWYIRYFAIIVKNATVLSFMSQEENASTDKIFNYDIFISYSDNDRDWVLNSLLPNLESKSKVNVCLHERDFQVGIGILENIISSIDRSRCILLVISQSFLCSQWCQFELHLAQHRLLETRREELLLLFLEEIPRMKRPKTLQYIMRTKTYILWPKRNDDEEGQKLFWKRLHLAILRNTTEIERKQISTV
jgi:Leucine-rich repeat (LRR) protein